MGVYEDNTKRFGSTDKLRCKCGSVRYVIKIFPDDDGERRWVKINCKKCGSLLYYEGA